MFREVKGDISDQGRNTRIINFMRGIQVRRAELEFDCVYSNYVH